VLRTAITPASLAGGYQGGAKRWATKA
jgi:hypothetical protein